MGAPKLSGITPKPDETAEDKVKRMLTEIILTLDLFLKRREMNLKDILTTETLEWWRENKMTLLNEKRFKEKEKEFARAANEALGKLTDRDRAILGLPKTFQTHNPGQMSKLKENAVS